MAAMARGTRSCSSSSVACTRGSAWKRSIIRSASSALASATSVMPRGARSRCARPRRARARRHRPADAVRRAVGVVDGVEEAVLARGVQPRSRRRRLATLPRRVDRQRQRRGIRRHDHFVAKAALEAQPGNAERLVLIRAVAVDDVVGGLRDAPGHTARARVVHLAAHDHAARRVEQGVGVRAHDEQRHQVLEQRRAPREQHRRAAARWSRDVRGGTSASRGRRPWRWRGSWRGAPRRPAGRSTTRRGGPGRRRRQAGSRCANSCRLRSKRKRKSMASKSAVGARGQVGSDVAAARRPASAAHRRGCRCRPSRHRQAAAASASACRTSSAGVPRDVLEPLDGRQRGVDATHQVGACR